MTESDFCELILFYLYFESISGDVVMSSTDCWLVAGSLDLISIVAILDDFSCSL